ncbi:putative toxin-antitoxin system toxin component, PIN family [Nitrospira sp. KM1]|uniref:putative toxin-antitoxin system toxin component, PIN family n=1 Tax=Nitrospira sp. KM1 TaxID=1936990 RepID=UPI0018DA08A3
MIPEVAVYRLSPTQEYLERWLNRVDACRDEANNRILEVTVNGHADAIVTGDTDLLSLNPFREIRIMNARGLHEIVLSICRPAMVQERGRFELASLAAG